jgi:hypothetical protein
MLHQKNRTVEDSNTTRFISAVGEKGVAASFLPATSRGRGSTVQKGAKGKENQDQLAQTNRETWGFCQCSHFPVYIDTKKDI